MESSSPTTRRGVIDGATSEWIPIVSCMTQGSVLGPLLFILYRGEIFDLVQNRQYAFADDSTLLAVVRKPAYTPAVTASLIRFRSGPITDA